MRDTVIDASGPRFWRDKALPFIEARSIRDARTVSYGRHWHEAFSVGLISRGRCKYINRGITTEAGVGTVVFMNPGDVHACNPVRGEPWSYKMVYIDFPWLCETQGASDINGSRYFAPLAAISSTRPELYAGLNRIFDTLMDRSVGLLEKQTASIGLVELLQGCLGTNQSTQPAKVRRLTRAADFIRENCARSLNLEEICREAGLSASYLIRAFKQAYGLTPHAYQLNCRIEFCRGQLRAGHTIADVALAAGFSDQAHFQRTFKRFVAATPGQYQSRHS